MMHFDKRMNREPVMNALAGEMPFGQRFWLQTALYLRRSGAALILSLHAAIAVAGLATLLVTSEVQAADKKAEKTDKPAGLQTSQKVGVPLQAAIAAIEKKDFEAALKKVDEADAAPKKTDFDQFKIDDIRAYVYVSQGKISPEVVAHYEKSLTTPEYLSPEIVSVRLQQLAIWAFKANDYTKAIDFGNRQLALHPEDLATLNLVALSKYNSKDYKGALASFDLAIAAREQAGGIPDEQWLRLVPSCASQFNDQARYENGFGKLVRYYPKPEHWEKLLNRVLDVEKNDLAMLYVFRLMSDVGVLNTSVSYLEYADHAVENAMPAEALTALEAGFEKKVLGVNDKEKATEQQKLADVKRKAQADKAQLPEIEKEAASAKGAASGQLTAGLGLAYFSFGMYGQAVTALDAGIKKGGLKNIDDYRMVLGISQLRTGQKELARASFQSVPATSPLARVANLWAIRTYN
jgi:tetratricopeptide (TPR) repeat protein